MECVVTLFSLCCVFLAITITTQGELVKNDLKRNINVIQADQPKDCADIYSLGLKVSGVYQVFVEGQGQQVLVYCDMSDGGGWTVFQRRVDGSVDFYQDWETYKTGFGDLYHNHWLGNDIIAAMTSQKSFGYKLRIDVKTFNNTEAHHEYTNFCVGSESDNYRLSLDNNTGSPDDERKGLSENNGHPFSTFDQDNDAFKFNCASEHHYKGGWWYSSYCGFTNLNGPYMEERMYNLVGDYIFWHQLDQFFSIKLSQMKFRPMDF